VRLNVSVEAPQNNKTTLSGGLVMLGKILRLTILASLLPPVTSFAQGNQGRERHILELRWAPASGWSFLDLTSEIPAPVADSPGARPAGYVRNADSTQHVVYRGTDGHIYELWWDATQCSQTTCWHWGNLTGSTGAPTLGCEQSRGIRPQCRRHSACGLSRDR
jgi:hypothetical protein